MTFPNSVLINCTSSRSGGAVSYLRNIIPRLVDRASSQCELVFIACRDQAKDLGFIDCGRTIWIDAQLPPAIRPIFERRWIRDAARSCKCEVVFTPYQVGPWVPEAKNILMIRNMEPFHFQRYEYQWNTRLRNQALKALSRQCLNRADRVIAVSGYAEAKLKDLGVDMRKAHRIYHGAPDADSGSVEADQAAIAEIGVSGAYIFTAGSLLPYRRLEDIVDAYVRLCNTLPQVPSLVVAGTGTDEKYIRKIGGAIDSSGCRSRIRLLGHVSWELISALYRNAEFVVFATEVEACPNVVLEAMAAGAAIISADCAPLPEILGECNLSYRARDVDALSSQMMILLKNDQLRHELRQKAMNRVQAFSWDVCADRTLDVLLRW